jgi:GTPase SAR1 family protein
MSCLCRHLGEVITSNPTVGSNVEEVVHRNVHFQVWDLGGQEKLRRVWSTYYVGAHAVVLVIDSMDRDRLPLVREELTALTSNEVKVIPPPAPATPRQPSTAVPLMLPSSPHAAKQHPCQT